MVSPRGIPNKKPIALEISSLLVSEPSGIAIFGKQLITQLIHLRGAESFCLVCRASRLRNRDQNPFPDLPLYPYWTGFQLSKVCSLLHCFDTRLPWAYRGPMVAMLYDVISALPVSQEHHLSPERFIKNKKRQYDRLAKRPQHIVTISEETRDRFRELYPFKGEIAIAYPGVDPQFLQPPPPSNILERYSLAPGAYLLSVGELCPRKNLELTVKVFWEVRKKFPELKLALVGRPSYLWEGSELQKQILKDPQGIVHLGFVSEEDLRVLYSQARAFLYLSLYEGFGMPILEAMATGTPVIASDRGGIPEAAGDAAILVSLEEIESIPRQLTQLLEEAGSELEQRILRGRARAEAFTWERAAESVLSVYDKVLGPN